MHRKELLKVKQNAHYCHSHSHSQQQQSRSDPTPSKRKARHIEEAMVCYPFIKRGGLRVHAATEMTHRTQHAGPQETAQSMKYLPHQYKDRCWSPRKLPCNPRLTSEKRQDRGFPRAGWPARLTSASQGESDQNNVCLQLPTHIHSQPSTHDPNHTHAQHT